MEDIDRDILDICEEFRAEHKLLDISCRTLEALYANYEIMRKQMMSENGEERLENAFKYAREECERNYNMASWRKSMQRNS